jgi:predicted RNase H-like nuclease (RuvC/YqgF family)
LACTWATKASDVPRTQQPQRGHTTVEDERVTDDPKREPYTDPLLYGMISDLKSNLAVLTEAVNNLKEKIDAQSSKLDKIEDVRRETAVLNTEVANLKTDLHDTKGKLDGVRKWVLAAGGVVAMTAALAPYVVPRLFPLPPTPSASQPSTTPVNPGQK